MKNNYPLASVSSSLKSGQVSDIVATDCGKPLRKSSVYWIDVNGMPVVGRFKGEYLPASGEAVFTYYMGEEKHETFRKAGIRVMTREEAQAHFGKADSKTIAFDPFAHGHAIARIAL